MTTAHYIQMTLIALTQIVLFSPDELITELQTNLERDPSNSYDSLHMYYTLLEELYLLDNISQTADKS